MAFPITNPPVHPLKTLTPYHTLLYSTLLGTSLYHTFILTKIAHRALALPAFVALQKRLFPVYFLLQTLLFIGTALTYPPRGAHSLFASQAADWIPLALGGGVAVMNLVVYGPRTGRAMEVVERMRAETRDGKDGDGRGREGKDWKAKKRAFSRAHAMCIHLNLLAVGATVWYGFRLSSRMKLVGS